jgi:hypothetical protein
MQVRIVAARLAFCKTGLKLRDQRIRRKFKILELVAYEQKRVED